MRGLRVEVDPGPITGIVADTVVVPIPTSERPLRGDAGRLDWRMCGRISEEILAGNLSGFAHEAVLIAGRPPLRAPRVMLLGIGSSAGLPGRGVQDAFRDLTQRLLGLCSRRALVAMPRAIDLGQDALPALRGCLHGVSTSREEVTLRLVLSGALPLLQSLHTALDELQEEADRRGVHVHVDAAPADVSPDPVAPPVPGSAS